MMMVVAMMVVIMELIIVIMMMVVLMKWLLVMRICLNNVDGGHGENKVGLGDVYMVVVIEI